MNNKFSQTIRRLEVREIELYIKIMNKILGIVVFSLFLNINVNAEIIGELITYNADKVQKGNIGLVDTYNKRIIEIDNKGKVIWEKKIPRKFKKATEIGHPDEGAITLSVNGVERQAGDLNQMIWKVPEQIAYLSRFYDIAAGDIIMSGTPAGVGPVERGDVLIGRVDGLGDFTTRVT